MRKMEMLTEYLGLQLKSPIVPSAGPLSKELGNIKKMEDNGAGAVVLYSLFEEQIENEKIELNQVFAHDNSHAEANSYFPIVADFKVGPDEYLEHLRKVKKSVDIPVLASLNGKSLGGWIEYAKKIEQAGADALELNIYRLAADVNKSGQEIENEYFEIIKEVKSTINIPVAVKISPFFSSISWMARQIEVSGADGLVLFNRFYQPDIDLENLEVVPSAILSTPISMRLPLRWIAILYGKLKLNLAATGGVYTGRDVIKLIMAGASITQMLSPLLKYGIAHISKTISEIEQWMEENEYVSLEQMRGSMSYKNVSDPSQFERSHYMNILNTFKVRT
jgi:dihydroorotate dehydrogenase (fumarate)